MCDKIHMAITFDEVLWVEWWVKVCACHHNSVHVQLHPMESFHGVYEYNLEVSTTTAHHMYLVLQSARNLVSKPPVPNTDPSGLVKKLLGHLKNINIEEELPLWQAK